MKDVACSEVVDMSKRSRESLCPHCGTPAEEVGTHRYDLHTCQRSTLYGSRATRMPSEISATEMIARIRR